MEIVKEEKTPGILRDAGEDWVTMWISRMVMKANLFEFRPAFSPSSQSRLKLSIKSNWRTGVGHVTFLSVTFSYVCDTSYVYL